MRQGPAVVLSIWCCAGAWTAAEAQDAAVTPPRPRLALALSGGGARGIAHVGALRALEEAGLPVDAIAANSMGAVVGSVYATGRTAAELEEIVRSLDWALLFSGHTDRRTLPVVRRDDHYADWIGVDFDWKRARLPAGPGGRSPREQLPDPEPLAGGLRGGRRLRPAGDPVSGGGDRPRQRRPRDPGEGRPGARGAGEHVDPRLLRARGAGKGASSWTAWWSTTCRRTSRRCSARRSRSRSTSAAPRSSRTSTRRRSAIASQVSNLLSGRRSQDFKAEPDVYIRPDLGKHAAGDYEAVRRADQGRLRGHAGERAAHPREARRGVRHGPRAARPKPDPDRVLAGARIAEVVARGNERASERLLRRTFNIPVGPGLRHGARPARLRQGRGDGAGRALLDGVRAGAGGRPHRAAGAGCAPEPRRDRPRLQRVGKGPRLDSPAQPEHAGLRRAARAAARRERRRDARPGVAARRPDLRPRDRLPRERLRLGRTSRASSTRRARS